LDKGEGADRVECSFPCFVERFNLKYHHETRELQAYSLVPKPKAGRKLPKERIFLRSVKPPRQIRRVVREAPRYFPGRMMMNPGHSECPGTPIDMLTHSLAAYLGRSVVDKNRPNWQVRFTLQWTPDNAPLPMLGGPGGSGGAAHVEAATDAPPISVFTAIQEHWV